MKKYILLFCLIPVVSFATTGKQTEFAAYQELCAKEQDPVKRRNYCHLLERGQESRNNQTIFRRDTAIA